MSSPCSGFARDPATAAYDDRRAAEYDECYLSGDQLADELGGQTVMDGRWFVAARTRWPSRR